MKLPHLLLAIGLLDLFGQPPAPPTPAHAADYDFRDKNGYHHWNHWGGAYRGRATALRQNRHHIARVPQRRRSIPVSLPPDDVPLRRANPVAPVAKPCGDPVIIYRDIRSIETQQNTVAMVRAGLHPDERIGTPSWVGSLAPIQTDTRPINGR